MTVKLILITAPDATVAQRLARGLVENRLAACANIFPGISSVYRWQGKVEQADELMLTVITTDDQVAPLTDWVIANHPYELPKVVALPIESGSQPYLDWVADSTR